MNIVVIPGTNRSGSLSGHLATTVEGCYRDLGHEVDRIDPCDMGADFLDPDAYREPAPAVGSMVKRFLAADGVVFIVPEYNGSYPGVIKLFIDMLPDPQGFEGRPCAFIGLAAGQFKGLRAVEHLQAVAGYRNAIVFPRRIFIGDSYKQFDLESGGRLLDQELEGRIREQAAGFVEFIGAVGGLRMKSGD